ncbi:MAG: hypothetical protein H0X46_09160 [Bacteroidetes bacterium]|nr:hypothetical protein [Bacteroidota bacterium]
MNYNILTYYLYFLLLLFIVLYVGAALYKNGRGFLINTFLGNVTLADAVNKFLLAGYYLINIGYTALFLKITENINTGLGVCTALSVKAGAIILTLGIVHIINVITLVIIGKNRKQNHINQ